MASNWDSIAAVLRSEIERQLNSTDDAQWECAVVKLEKLDVPLSARMVRAIDRAIHKSPEWRRNRILSSLAIKSFPECYSSVVLALDHPDASTRDYACQALGRMALQKAAPHLRRRLKDGDEEVRFSAVEALSWVPGGISVGEMRAVLDEEESELVRLAAVEALVRRARERRGDRVVDRILVAHQERETDRVVRCELLIWSYWRTGSLSALKKLVALMHDDQARVRSRAYESIPRCLPVTHATFVLAAIRDRLRSERLAALKGRLREAAHSIETDCARSS